MAKRSIELDALRRFMDNSAGRDWLYGMLGRCEVYTVRGPSDALTMAFCEGQRNIGLQFMSEFMEAAPEKYLLMLKEAHDAIRRKPSGSDDADADADSEPNAGDDADASGG